MHIDDAGLASEGGANGQAVSTVNMEITGRRESEERGKNMGEAQEEAEGGKKAD